MRARVSVLLEPADPDARPRRADHRPVASRHRRRRVARRDAGAPQRRGTAGARRPRGRRGPCPSSRALRQPRHERRARRARAPGVPRAVSRPRAAQRARRGARRERPPGRRRVVRSKDARRGLGQGAGPADDAQCRLASAKHRTASRTSSPLRSGSGPKGWSSRTFSSSPGRSTTAQRSFHRTNRSSARARSPAPPSAASKARCRSSSSFPTGTRAVPGRAWTVGRGGSSSSRPTAPSCRVMPRGRCRSRSRPCARVPSAKSGRMAGAPHVPRRRVDVRALQELRSTRHRLRRLPLSGLRAHGRRRVDRPRVPAVPKARARPGRPRRCGASARRPLPSSRQGRRRPELTAPSQVYGRATGRASRGRS